VAKEIGKTPFSQTKKQKNTIFSKQTPFTQLGSQSTGDLDSFNSWLIP